MSDVSVPLVTLNNDLAIPQLGLGLWKASDEDAENSVAMAIEAGYRLIDTATIYGNEKGVGRGIAKSGVPREELFITTKLWNADQGYDSTLKAFDESLSKLGLDYIDLYLIHWPVPAAGKFIDTWRAFEKLHDEGRVKSIGVSNFKTHHLEVLLASSMIAPSVNQIELHPRFPQAETRQFCEDHNIKVESWSPIGGSAGADNILNEPVLKNIGEKYGKSPAQVILRWHIQLGLIVIPKSIHEERIRQNIDIFDFELSEDDMAQIATLETGTRQGPDPDTMNNV